MLTRTNSALIIVDVQGKLAQLMHGKEALFANLQRIVKGIQVLEIPILWAEQNPKGLGPTIPEVANLLPDKKPIPKFSFNCCKDDAFMQALNEVNRKQILITGIETHICVYQTAVDLVEMGYEVQVVTDAVSSRTAENKEVGIQKMSNAGVHITSTEMALFELLEKAEGPRFKQILKIVK